MAGPEDQNNPVQQLLQLLLGLSGNFREATNNIPGTQGLDALTNDWRVNLGTSGGTVKGPNFQHLGAAGLGDVAEQMAQSQARNAQNPWLMELINGGPEGGTLSTKPWNPSMLNDIGGTIRDTGSNVATGVGNAAGAVGGAVGSALKFPFQHPFVTAAGGGGIAEILHLLNGGGNTTPNQGGGGGGSTPFTAGGDTGPLGFAGGVGANGQANFKSNFASPGGSGANGSTGNPLLDMLMKNPAFSSLLNGGETQSQRTNAEANMIQAQAQSRLADAQILNYKADQEYKMRDAAVKEGNLDLAKVHENNANVWSRRAADATDEANSLTARGQDVTVRGQDITARGQDVTARGQDVTMRGQDLTAKAAGNTNLTSLVNVIGGLLNSQNEMQFKLNSTPMNAIASLLMSRGQDPGGQASYGAPRMLGIDPNMFTQLMQTAIAGGGQFATDPNQGTTQVGGVSGMPGGVQDMSSLLAGLAQRAQSASSGVRQPAPPTDATGSIVGNRVTNYPR